MQHAGLRWDAEATCVPCSSILLEFILHLFYFWFFTTLRSHVKIKNRKSVLNDSKVLFLSCLRDFSFSTTSCNCSAEIWELIDVHSPSQLQSQVQKVYLSQHLFQVPYTRKKPRKPRTCWSKILLFVGPSKCSSSTHCFLTFLFLKKVFLSEITLLFYIESEKLSNPSKFYFISLKPLFATEHNKIILARFAYLFLSVTS